MTNKPSVFISYSHNDTRWMKRVVKQLGALERECHLSVWHDRLIGTGTDWLPQILEAIQNARAAVFLVSPSFLDSGFVLEQEVPAFLEKRAHEGLRIFPVLVEPCLWEAIGWLNRMQLKTFSGAKALSEGSRVQADRALVEVAKEIFSTLKGQSGLSSFITEADSSLSRSAAHELPAPPLDFTGRTAELALLRAAVQEGKTTAIFGVRGMGGVGKTTLALKLAHEIAPFYPDGQIFLDLQGVTTPLSAAQAMGHVVHALQPEGRPPASEHELVSRYRSALYGKRILLLMDNAASADQVEALIPPPGSVFLITSRFRFTLPGLTETDLEELPREQARDLLLKICPRAEPIVEELAQLCGDLPLALRVTARTLQEQRTLSLKTYLERLSAGREHLEPVDKALSLSDELLPEELRQFWYKLSIFPDTFDSPASAAIARINKDLAEKLLSELDKRSLVSWNSSNGRYHLHELVRSFGGRRLDDSERRAVQERHAQFYLSALRFFLRLYQKGGEHMLQALRLLDLEWVNVQSGQAFAEHEANLSDEAARLCSDYPDMGTSTLVLRQSPQEQLRWRKPALAAARRLKDREAEARHLANIGAIHLEMRDFPALVESSEQAVEIAREIGDRKVESYALGNLGASYVLQGEPRRALGSFEAVLAITRETGDRWGEVNSLNNMAAAYIDLESPAEVIRFAEEALNLARQIGDHPSEGIALGNLGNAYATLKDVRALDCYEQWIAITRLTRDRRWEAHASWELGLLYKERDPDRAVELMQACVDIWREIGHSNVEARAAKVDALRALIQSRRTD